MGTPAEESVEVQDAVLPIQIIIHIGGTHVTKTETPAGNLTELTIVSPTGIGVTIRMTDENVERLVKDLTGGVLVPQNQLVIAR